MIKSKLRFILIAVLLIACTKSFGQSIRGFYLTGIGGWLGNTIKEDEILQYSQDNGFNYISLYNLSSVNWSNSNEKNKLAAFISKARNQFGVIEMGAVAENYAFIINNILPYNDSRSNTDERFDVLNLEFEFWSLSSINNAYCHKYLTPGGYTCDSAGAFKFGIEQLKLIDSVCAIRGLISEVYLGWPNKGQMQQLAIIADRILLHAYRPDDGDIYIYSKSRLIDIASVNRVTKVIPLFSGEPVFMGPWLNTNHVSKPFNTFSNEFNAETSTFRQNIDLQGYQWFTYDHLPKTNIAFATITANGPFSFCPGDSVLLTANPGTSYSWQPGGQTTQTIAVKTPGSYTVNVTNSNGMSVISDPVVVSYSTTGIIPVVTASGTTSFCTGGSVTLTSSPSPSYLWSNGATTQSISTGATGNYSVTTGIGSCIATSSAVNVNANAAPVVPVITSSGSLNLCSGDLLVLTSSASGNYLWSNGATTRSIVVSSAGNYFVTAGYGQGCTAQSLIKSVTLFPSPAVPVIAVSGSLTLTPAQPSISLTSSFSNSYLWSTGEISNSINVSTQGTYRVTVTDVNGCSAVSDPVTVIANGCSPPPIPTISVNGSIFISAGGSVTLTSSLASGYLWSNGSTDNAIVVSDSGSYSVRCYNAAGCFSTSLPVQIILVTDSLVNGVSSIKEKNNVSFSLFPNPVVDAFNIAFTAERRMKINFSLIDVTGKEILKQEKIAFPGENQFEISVQGLSRGIYFACLFYEEEKQIIKVIVQ